MTHQETGIKSKVRHEVGIYVFYTVYLTLVFTAFTYYRHLILGEFGFDYTHYGYNVIEAAILAKIIMMGQVFKLGERFQDKPLIIPTLYRTIIFMVFVFLFSLLEDIVVEHFVKGEALPAILDKLINEGIYEILQRIWIMFFVFIFLFAFLEVERVLGENKVYNLFFKNPRWDNDHDTKA